jgi:Ala-tRNA(Pro) deacylase
MIGHQRIFETLKALEIPFDYYEHPPAPTIEIAQQYWKDIDAVHSKNLFFRNHKGNKHYLVVFEHLQNLAIHDLEKRLKQGKLSFASEARMMKYLGLFPGSVSPFGIVNDTEQHVYLFLDKNLQKAEKVSFHPNDNRADVVISFADFLRFLEFQGNQFEFLELY